MRSRREKQGGSLVAGRAESNIRSSQSIGSKGKSGEQELMAYGHSLNSFRKNVKERIRVSQRVPGQTPKPNQ